MSREFQLDVSWNESNQKYEGYVTPHGSTAPMLSSPYFDSRNDCLHHLVSWVKQSFGSIEALHVAKIQICVIVDETPQLVLIDAQQLLQWLDDDFLPGKGEQPEAVSQTLHASADRPPAST
jgi:hypothetical protein